MLIAFWLLAGTVALYFGAEWLVRGSAALALRLGMTPLLAGLTVVAYGTSSPELVVSLTAAASGQGAIAIGNVVGSTIFNLGFILGLTALITPLRVQSQLVKFDTPVMIGVAAVFLLFFRDGRLDRWEAALLLAGLAAYITLNVVLARRGARQTGELPPVESLPAPSAAWWKDAALIVGGLIVLVLGSRWFVHGAVDLARQLGLSEAVIGLTIVAAGTSLPELAASVVAAAQANGHCRWKHRWLEQLQRAGDPRRFGSGGAAGRRRNQPRGCLGDGGVVRLAAADRVDRSPAGALGRRLAAGSLCRLPGVAVAKVVCGSRPRHTRRTRAKRSQTVVEP